MYECTRVNTLILISFYYKCFIENSQTIKDMLTNKHLQQVLTDIDKDENGQIELDAAMKLPIFTEFANECLKLVDDKFEDTVK